MNIYDFHYLPHEEKGWVVWNLGIYLGERLAVKYSVMLYQIEGFYVEVFYFKNKKTPNEFRCFTTTDLLAPYINTINITQLFQ